MLAPAMAWCPALLTAAPRHRRGCLTAGAPGSLLAAAPPRPPFPQALPQFLELRTRRLQFLFQPLLSLYRLAMHPAVVARLPALLYYLAPQLGYLAPACRRAPIRTSPESSHTSFLSTPFRLCPELPHRYTEYLHCGRLFSEQELELIRTIIAEDSSRHRFALSQVVCERLHWRRANGQLKDMSCRVAMLRMHRDGLIPLPAPRRRHSNGTLHRRRTPQAEPELPIIARVDALPALQVRPLADQREAQLWREYVDRYHYLGYTPLPGAQMRYLVTSQRRVLAVVGFGASAWKAAPRDRFIGWSVAQREARLQLVVNNARFLILPWVQVRNLASTVLARSRRRLPDDWQARYGYRPLLLETFVQSDRFAGTSCRAANWTHVGQTQGRGKLDVHRTHALPRKDIWLYPLRRDFRRRLCAPLDPPPHQ